MNSHKLIVNKSVVENDFSGANRYHSDEHKEAHRNLTGDNTLYQLFYQMSRLTFDKGSLRHDDRLDALSMAVAYWVERMELHTDKAVAEYRDEQIDKALEAFNDSYNALWNKDEVPETWMSR